MSVNLKTFTNAMEDIQKQIINMGKIAEKQMLLSVDSFIISNNNYSRKVFELDKVVDQYDNQIHSSILQLITLQPPLPDELQTLTTMMRMSREFERVGDHAVNIAEISEFTNMKEESKAYTLLFNMCQHTVKMLSDSLDVLSNKNILQAREIVRRDDEIDRYFYENQKYFVREMYQDNNEIESLSNLLLVNRYLERSADHVVNVMRQIEKRNY